MTTPGIHGKSFHVFGTATDVLIFDATTGSEGAVCSFEPSDDCEDVFNDGAVEQPAECKTWKLLEVATKCNAKILPVTEVSMSGFGELQLKTTQYADIVTVLDTAPVTKIYTQVTQPIGCRPQLSVGGKGRMMRALVSHAHRGVHAPLTEPCIQTIDSSRGGKGKGGVMTDESCNIFARVVHCLVVVDGPCIRSAQLRCRPYLALPGIVPHRAGAIQRSQRQSHSQQHARGFRIACLHGDRCGRVLRKTC